jgi:trk system potassium uptake protein TrkA
MRIIILGAGESGFHLARMLSLENHDISIVDFDATKIERIRNLLDVQAITGHGTNLSILKQAGIDHADMLVAVTSTDEVNILACMIAKRLNVGITVARVRNEEYISQDSPFPLAPLGVDLAVNPEEETAKEILQLIKYPQVLDMVEFEEGRVVLVGVKLDADSPVLGKALRVLAQEFPAPTYRIVAVNRGGSTLVPTGDDSLQADDRIYVMTLQESLPNLFPVLGKKEKEVKNVMILGGGKIGRAVAAILEKDKKFLVKLIESDQQKSRWVAENLKNTMVVYGDGTDIDLMATEGILDMDVYIAVTEDDENNIVSSLVARHLKVDRTITLISKADYFPVIKAIGLDLAVNKKFVMANTVLRFIRHGRIVTMAALKGIEGDMIEFQVSAKSKIVGKFLREVDFPKGSIVAAISHDDKVSIAVGESKIYVGDRVIVYTLPHSERDVVKLFD